MSPIERFLELVPAIVLGWVGVFVALRAARAKPPPLVAPPPRPPAERPSDSDVTPVMFSHHLGFLEKRCPCRLGEGTRHVEVYTDTRRPVGQWIEVRAENAFRKDAPRLAAEGWYAVESHWEAGPKRLIDLRMDEGVFVATYEWFGTPPG